VDSTYYLAGTASSTESILEQFSDLVESLRSYDLIPAQSGQGQYLISVNHNPNAYKKFIRSGGSSKRAVLIMLEPSAVFPSQYKKRVQQKYSLVLAPGNAHYSPTGKSFIPWPYESIPNPLRPLHQNSDSISNAQHFFDPSFFNFENWVSRSKFLVMINANKVSPISIENYSLRRKVASTIPGDFLSVYGGLWNSSLTSRIKHRLGVAWFSIKSGVLPNLWHIYGNLLRHYPNAYGEVADKQVVLRNAKFSVVIENDSNYVSEKLFDSVINGCIPIYYGGELPTRDILKDLAIPLDCEPQLIIEKLESLSENEIRKYLKSMSDFVRSSEFVENWTKPRVFQLIAKEIANHLKDPNV
jgi:hypothetical protein